MWHTGLQGRELDGLEVGSRLRELTKDAEAVGATHSGGAVTAPGTEDNNGRGCCYRTLHHKGGSQPLPNLIPPPPPSGNLPAPAITQPQPEQRVGVAERFPP